MEMSEPRYSTEILVEALYRGILSRAPDEKGFLNHVGRLRSLGADAPNLTTLVRGFLSSREYQEKANSQFVQKLIARSALLNPETIDFVSLGSHCLVSYTLKEMGLKRYSCPFDWIFSRPAMVEHCIKDSFAMLADRSQYQSVTDESGTELAGRCHHAFYRNLFGVQRLFNHRDMRIEENYQYLLRCIRRFSELLESTNRKVFVLLSPELQVNNEAFISLHNTLSISTSNFSLIVIVLKNPRDVMMGFGIDYIKSIGPSCLAAMRPISEAGPFSFVDPFDDFIFRRAVVTFEVQTRNPPSVKSKI